MVGGGGAVAGGRARGRGDVGGAVAMPSACMRGEGRLERLERAE